MGRPTSTNCSVHELTASDEDYLAALHLAATARPGPPRAVDPIVEDLLRIERTRNVRLRPLVAAYKMDRLEFAVAGVESPGATSLLLVPFELRVDGELAVMTLREAVTQSRGYGVRLCQVIGPDRMSSWDTILQQAGLTHLTDLVYLSAEGRARVAATQPNRSVRALRWVGYSELAEQLFCEAIASSYVQSQDCPELIDARTAEEALQSHRCVGEFDPATWFVLADGRRPAGVLLLNKVRRERVLEVVYMGVSQDMRGRGVADALMLKAQEVAAQKNSSLILAVDVRNAPAKKLYARWNFVEVARRRAWIAKLHGAEC